MKVKLAIIGGTGVYDPEMLTNLAEHKVRTRYGEVGLLIGEMQGHSVAFMARHGSGHSVPPHMINYRANISALKELGVQRIIATSAVGSLNAEMRPGQCVIMDQFLDFTRNRPSTFFDGGEMGVAHVDLTDPYCPELRELLIKTANKLEIQIHAQGTYVCTEGPRYESAAEVKAFRMLGGDLLGMTSVPEVVLAREAEICYASVAIVTNWAAGITQEPLTHQEVVACMQANVSKLRELIRHVSMIMPAKRGCRCQYAIH